MECVEVAIIGAGLGGLALALGLQQRGITAHLFEKTDGLTADTATGISIGLNGGRALDGLRPAGLLEAMSLAGSATKSVKIFDYTQGQEPVEIETNKSPVVFMITWKRARQILFELIPNSNIHCLHTLRSYSPGKEDGVELTFSVKDETGSTQERVINAKLLIGSDGIHSAVRRMMVGDRPRDLHLINWNALVHNPDSKFFKVHEKDQLIMIRDGAIFAHLVDSGEGYTLWVLRIHDEELPGSGFGGASVKERVLKKVEELKPAEIWQPMKTAIEATNPSLIFERRIIDNPPLKTWSDLDGRVLLIGDAAHGMHWGPGQGARTAFEDAHQLSEILSPALLTGDPAEIQKAVTKFEELRIPRMTRFQQFAAEGTCLPEFIPEWVQELSIAERRKRMVEFQTWADSYPDKIACDPESVYFN